MLSTAINPGKRAHDPAQAAEWLRLALLDLGITADVHNGDGISLVSVWIDLVVWSDGTSYIWWSGQKAARTGRWKYHYGPTDDPLTVARRVADRFRDLAKGHPMSGVIREVLKDASGQGTGAPL